MRKIFSAHLAFALLLFLLVLFVPKKTYADCNFTLTPTTVDPSQNTEFTIRTSDPNCFGIAPSTTYYVFVYPQEKDSRPSEWIQFFGYPSGVKSQRGVYGAWLSFIVDFPREQHKIRSYQQKPWLIRVCERPLADCAAKPDPRTPGSPTFVVLAFTMGVIPTPTPSPAPSNLPIVEKPTRCVYQKGSSIDVTIKNIVPRYQYAWWWSGDKDPRNYFTSASDTKILPISGDFTKDFSDEEKTFCVNITTINICRKGDQHSATFLFTKKPPKGDTSCAALTPPTPTPVILPTCAPQPGCSPGRPFPQCGDKECNGEIWEHERLIGVCEYTCGEELRYVCTPIGKVPQQCDYFPTPTPFPCPVCPETHPRWDPPRDLNGRCCEKEGKPGECKSPVPTISVSPCDSEAQCGFGYGCGLGSGGPCGKKKLPDGTITDDYVCDTAIGKFDVTPQAFVKRIFGLLLGISGGVALLLILYSAYRLMASRGDPEKLQGARETLTSAIVGLLFIIFSLIILEIVGVDILKIPGLER